MVPMGTHEWSQYLDASEVENILRPSGLETLAKAGAMVTNPLSMEMDLFPNWLRGNYMMLSRKIR